MKIELDYNRTTLVIDLPSNATVDLFAPAQTSLPERELLLSTLKQAGVGQLPADGLLFVVNDGHRNTPTCEILKLIKELNLEAVGTASFLIACGTHEAPSAIELATIFGDLLPEIKDRIRWHDAADLTRMDSIGNDQFGEEVFLNSQIGRADSICVISSVEPHYFAGFTGGRKSFFPGLTDLATIERNHNLANSLDAQPMRLTGNPVAEHMDNLLTLIDTDRLVSIQAVLDADHQVAGLFAGDMTESFGWGVKMARQRYTYSYDRPYDLVITELGPPLDANLYQVQKGLENCSGAVANGGACVVLSACHDGVGSNHFFELANSWNRDKNRPETGEPGFGSHKLSRVNQLSKKITVGLKSELDGYTVNHVFYEPVSDLTAFIAERATGQDEYRIAVVKDGGNRVMRLEQTKNKQRTKN